MKIALIGTVAQSAILFRKDMIIALKEKNHEVFVFCTDFTPDSKKQIESLGAVAIDYTLNRAGLNPFKDIKDTLNLSKKLKELKIDISFSYFVKPVIFGTIASKLAGVKKRFAMLEGLGYVFTDLPNGVSRKQKFLRFVQVLLYKISMPLLDKIIFLNPDDPKDLIEKYKIKVKKVEVLGAIGLNLDEYSYTKAPKDKIRFIFIGRLLAEKGIFEYMKAAKILKKDFTEVEFVVLGGLDEQNPGGLKKEELEELLKENIIIYPGFVKDVNKYIENSSVFLLPSYREGVPRSTQEAMAIGRAVITTDVPGCRETVIDGLNGFLIPPFKEVELANAMKKFIENPKLIEQMGDESYKIAKDKFDAKKVNEKLIKVLEI
ncbi:glycosyltransferase family 4 protein [Aliarcobacter thereius]|uniref:glycosyltransferase family 4 protein n=1 Tax=Aliarcobacter thereius TaxID=544718 RepID=UPI0008268344|nr:glycosyltransferase family 4 protein [Aliarcobacter thereius]OCL91216.1 N,N'-diacetylbacillosaminyl-diphospho-undecaprenol alpha-1,3-N-acetylgalactosaminyltransferase [Aliarcobacter thereius]